MKKALSLRNIVATLLIASTVFFTSCVKNRNDGAVDFSQLAPTVLIPEGGLSHFSAQAIVFPGADPIDSTLFRINYAGTTVAPADVSVSFAINDAARVQYNIDHPTGQYDKMPDSVYKFTATSAVVKAGQSYSAPIYLTIYPNKLNVSKSYMLPITITSASGVTISANFGTVFWHIIGNPLAGDYQDYGQRFNYLGVVAWPGPPAGLALATAPGVPSVNPPAGPTGITTYNFVNTFLPVDGQTVSATVGNVPDPYSGLAYYFVTGTDPTFAAIVYDLEPTWYVNPGGGNTYSNTERFVRGYIPPSPTQKPAFRLVTHYNNATGGTGNDRIIDETFLHL